MMRKNIMRLISYVVSMIMVITTISIPVSANVVNGETSGQAVEMMEPEEVIEGLENQIDYYQNLMNVRTDSDSQEKITRLIQTTEELLATYENSVTESGAILTRSSNGVLDVAVATMISGFSAAGYRLSAELLTHARDNTSLNSTYIPVNSDVLWGSPLLADIWTSGAISDSAVFPKVGGVPGGIDPAVGLNDLFYAIHKFDYYKKISLPNQYLEITDTYDFASGDYSSFAGVLVDTMYEAQEAGILTPYEVQVRIDPNDLIWL